MKENQVTKYFIFEAEVVDSACGLQPGVAFDVMAPSKGNIILQGCEPSIAKKETVTFSAISAESVIPDDEFTKTVNFGAITAMSLNDGNSTANTSFNLEIYNDPVNLKTYASFSVNGITSDGVTLENDLVGNDAYQAADNVGLIIHNFLGERLRLGEVYKMQLNPGNNSIPFSAALTRIGEGTPGAGHFRALAECVVTYSDS